MKRFLYAWAPALALALVIFTFSAQPRLSVDTSVPAFDKVMHFGAYGLLGVLLAHGGRLWPLATAWVVALGVGYGASDEIHQMLVPGRFPEFLDWVADAAGVVAGVYLYNFWHGRRRRAAPAVPAEADFIRT